MPRQVVNVEEFLELAKRAHECRVKRSKDVVKLKLRLPRELVTLVTEPEKEKEILDKIAAYCPIVHV